MMRDGQGEKSGAAGDVCDGLMGVTFQAHGIDHAGVSRQQRSACPSPSFKFVDHAIAASPASAKPNDRVQAKALYTPCVCRPVKNSPLERDAQTYT